MSPSNKRLAQRLIAIIVIIAILEVIGFSPAVIIFVLVAGLIVWRTVRHSEHQETERIFEFYIAADEVLRDEGRQWYGFEIAEVIDAGERIVISVPDPPPLCRFTLGVLYHRIEDFESAVEHLTWVMEDSFANEAHRTSASPQLRRYVETLRRIEREPAMAPHTLAAIRNLERIRRRRAAEILADSSQRLKDTAPRGRETQSAAPDVSGKERTRSTKPLSLITAPPPISEVLRDVYQSEDKKTA